MGTEILTRAPQVVLTRPAGPSVGAVYVNPDDLLRIEAEAAVAGLTLRVVARILTPDGRVTPSAWDLPLVADRSTNLVNYPLPEGWLISVVASVYGAFVPRGGALVRAFLLRSAIVAPVIAAVLLEGYVAWRCPISWGLSAPESGESGRGRLYRITGTDPAAGAEISETVPTNALWRLRAVRLWLTTSAVAGNRVASLVIDDSSNIIAVLDPPVTQAASLAYRYSWAPIGSRAVAIGTDQQCMLPHDLLLPSGYRFRTVTTAKDAGDDYGPPYYLVEEWIIPS